MENKKIAILQSNYIPWKGYFDLINSVDEFIIYDDMQFTKRDWRNRNLIKTKDGLKWLTIPVITKGKYYQSISETKAEGNKWREEHWKSVLHNYSKAKCFKKYEEVIKGIYLARSEDMLTNVNVSFIKAICEILKITTKLSFSSDYELRGEKTERLVSICKQSGASEYVTGPSAKNYIQDNLFNDVGIRLTYFDYAEYPEYSQLYGQFKHGVTVLDLIFNEGDNASSYMKTFPKQVTA